MANIALTNTLGSASAGPATLTRTTLTASDTMTGYVEGADQYLILANNTGSPITATLVGSGSTTINVPGYGSLNVSGGKAVPVAANSTVIVPLDDIAAYLKGTVTVTGGTGLIATLIG